MEPLTLIADEEMEGYTELMFGLSCMHHPMVHNRLLEATTGAVLPTSCCVEGRNQSWTIPTNTMIARFSKSGLDRDDIARGGFRLLNAMFLISMWDKLTATPRYREICTKREVQFLRHVRNACAHGYTFNFDELKYPAEWREKRLTMAHVGTPVFPDMLEAGDPLILIVDISELYFGPTTTPAFLRYKHQE